MKNFLIIYYAPEAAIEAMAKASPEEKMAGMKPWMDWKSKHENSVIDFGAPLMSGENCDAKGKWKNCDKEVSGYSVVQAKDEKAAKAMVKNHPHLTSFPGCAIGVHSFIAM